MRSEEVVNERLSDVRKTLEEATMSMSKGKFDFLDFTGVASVVGIIQTLEWVLGESDELNVQICHPLRRPLEEI
ncbi:hypothetical protein ACFL3H_07155 [Gemmatimonadota bacterium]